MVLAVPLLMRSSTDLSNRQVLTSIKLAARLLPSRFQEGVGHPNHDGLCTLSGHVEHFESRVQPANPKVHLLG